MDCPGIGRPGLPAASLNLNGGITEVTENGSWTPRPRLEGTVRADVGVIGLGGSGLAALEHLHELGVSAVGLDARMIGSGAAGRNGGFILAGLAKSFHETVAQFGREPAAAIHRATQNEIARQAAAMPGMYRLDGSLRIAADAAEREDCGAHLAALLEAGFPAEWYRGPEGEGVLLPTDGAFQPLARLRVLAKRLSQSAVQLYEGSPVRKLLPGQIITDAGVVRCASIIVAVDGRLERIFPELAPRVRTARLQMLATGPAPEVDFPRPVYRRHGYEYWQQRPDRSIALGGFRDHALEQEWTQDGEPTEFIQGLLEKFLREHLKVKAPVTHRWAASVGYTPDALPVLEEVRPETWALGGYNGTGNIVGALCGQAAARLACGQASEWAELLRSARR